MRCKVSIVIVSWNVRDLLIDCIKPFYNVAGIEIIIVDNNSKDDTVESLERDFPLVKLIKNKHNPGFATANNQGFKIAEGEYVYILNPDTFSYLDDLNKMIRILDFDPLLAGVGPKIFYGNGAIQRSCARKSPTFSSQFLINILNLHKLPFVGNTIEKKIKYPYHYDVSGPVEACSGAAYLVRNTLLQQVKGFDIQFLHTGEDVDLMLKMTALGYKNYYCAESTLRHYAGQSSKQDIKRVLVNVYISTSYLLKKHYGNMHSISYRVAITFIELPKIFAKIVFASLDKPQHLRTTLEEFIAFSKAVLLWKPIGR